MMETKKKDNILDRFLKEWELRDIARRLNKIDEKLFDIKLVGYLCLFFSILTVGLMIIMMSSCSAPKLTAKGKRTLRESGYGSDKCHEKKEWLPEMIKI